MRHRLIGLGLFLAVFACSGWAQTTTILDTDFSDWDAGTINSSYVLPSGWTMMVSGMEIVSDQVYSGTQSLKCPDESSGSIRFGWTAVDPSASDIFKVTLYVRLGENSKVEKGAALFDQNMVDGLDDPAIYWYEYPASTVGSREYRVRDRCNATGTIAQQVYGSEGSYYQAPSNDLRTWVKWQLV